MAAKTEHGLGSARIADWRFELPADPLASWLLAEFAEEDDFDYTVAHSADKLVRLAHEALSEHRSG